MGLMQRRKGKKFEQAIAREFRQHWPDAVVRRASQAERADNPDVFIEGGPPVLHRLWLELQDAAQPTPLAKLEQAEDDVAEWRERRGTGIASVRAPVVVWHKLGARTVNVTCRASVFDALRGHFHGGEIDRVVVTMSLDDFIGVLKRGRS